LTVACAGAQNEVLSERIVTPYRGTLRFERESKKAYAAIDRRKLEDEWRGIPAP